MISVESTKRVPLSDLAEFPANARQGDVGAIVESLKAHGQYRAIVVNKRSGEVLAGNHTLAALREIGAKDALVHYVDVDEDQAKRIVLVDNRTNDLASYDDQALVELLRSLPDLEGTGYSGDDLDDLLTLLDPVERTSGDTEPGEPPAEPTTKPGDLWVLGEHRLLCGDCRDASGVYRLLNGRKANLIVTSPPYASQRAYDEDSGFQPVKPDAYGDWFAPLQASLASVLEDDGSFLLNIKEHCEGGQRHLYVKDLVIRMVREWGWMFVDEFCWRDARNGIPGSWPNRLKDAWEPVFHFSRSGRIRFNRKANASESDMVFDYSPNTSKATTGSGLLGSEKATPMRSGLAQASNVLEIATASTGGHSAAYPVELPAWFTRLLTDAGDLVLDPFMGSGSTLIACENEGRVGYGIEISPGYCDVIVRRWEEHTGKEAVLDARE